MTRRPLIKWKSFWLGILVLGFLGWASLDSRQYARGCDVPVAGGRFLAIRAQDSTFLAFGRCQPAARVPFYRGPVAPRKQVEDEYATFREFGFYCVGIPDPLVFFSVAGLWVAWLFWRVRRQRKLTTNASAFS